MTLKKILHFKLFILITVLFVFGISTFLFQNTYRDRFYPGISIAGSYVEGKTYNEVLTEIGAKVENLKANGFQLTIAGEQGTKNIVIPMIDVGLTSDNVVRYFSVGDWQSTVKEAYDWGRSESIIDVLERRVGLFFGGRDFHLPITLNNDVIKALIFDETEGFLNQPAPAGFVIASGEVSIVKEQKGESIDADQMVSIIDSNLALLKTQTINFKAKAESPLASEETLTPFLSLANELAKKAKITLYYQTHKWSVSDKTLVSWLTLKTKNELGINTEKLEGFLSKTVAPLIDDPPQDSRFEIQDGKLIEIAPGKPGDVVDVAKTAAKIEDIIPKVQKAYAATGDISIALNSAPADRAAGYAVVKIPIEIIHANPKITKETVNEYKIQDLIGIATTNFAGGTASRQHNIANGAKKLNGQLIPPGAEFSAINGLGPITEGAGFTKEYVIKGDKTVKEIGGGLCQVGTTLFRMALNAGLPITERINHSFIIHYYGPGLDATIYGPHPDLRFVNDTGNYLLLQGAANKNEVTFELYGVKDGRKAEVTKPVLSNFIPPPPTKYVPSAELALGETKCSEIPKEGITADVIYTVTYADGSTKQQNFHSVYEPWQKVCLIGTSPSPPPSL